MTENENRLPHLQTRFIFVDTQALRKARFDWNGRTFSKVAEFAKAGQIRLLVTDITVGEVRSQLRELLSEASSSIIKHSGILEQLGASIAVECMKDQEFSLSRLETAFGEFLKRTNAVSVPLISDVNPSWTTISLGDLRLAPRKRQNSRTRSQLHLFVAGASNTIRQLTSFPMILTYEGVAPRMVRSFHSASILEIISQATVTQEVHDALEKALGASEYLSDKLAEEIKDFRCRVQPPRQGSARQHRGCPD